MATAPHESFCFFRDELFSGARFEEHCSNISRDILDSVFYHFSCTVYYVITFLISIIQKRLYLQNEKRYFKKESAILLYFEKLFKLPAIIFHFIGTLIQIAFRRGQIPCMTCRVNFVPSSHQISLCLMLKSFSNLWKIGGKNGTLPVGKSVSLVYEVAHFFDILEVQCNQ